MCINESDRPPYLNSFWWRHPHKEYETKTIRKGFLANVTSCFCARWGAMHRTVSRTNKWMKFIAYIPPVKPEVQAQVCSPAVDRNYYVRQWQSGKDVDNYSTSRGEINLHILPQVIKCDCCCFSRRALHGVGVHKPCSHRSVVRWGGHMRWPYVYCLCLAGRVSFSTRALVQSPTTANQRRT